MVKVGPFARGGKSRTKTQAADHDFKPQATVTPVGILVPQTDELFLYGVISVVTSDSLVDCIERWWDRVQSGFSSVTTLLLNLDNGPENNSHRTQFMYRLVQFANKANLIVRLAYYPPYHSKYNPIERCWGVLECHWNGVILDNVDTVLRFAETMTWKGKRPAVEQVSTIYNKGLRLGKQAMRQVEAQLTRLPDLGRWFVDIVPSSRTG